MLKVIEVRLEKSNAKLTLNFLGSGYNNIINNKSKHYDWVDVIPTDSLVNHADFVKMDVEGAELMVLKGMNLLMEKSKPPIILEISKEKNKITLFLEKNHYKIVLSIGHNFLAVHEDDLEKIPHLVNFLKEFEEKKKINWKLVLY